MKRKREEDPDDISTLSKRTLQELCRKRGLKISGNKADLCIRLEGTDNNNNVNELPPPVTGTIITVKDYEKKIFPGIVFSRDLRTLPPVNFCQLYQYLVLRTSKYASSKLSGTEYKVLKSYKGFKEGKIRKIETGKRGTSHFVKAQTQASMRVQTLYKQCLETEVNGDILRASCACPAGLGVSGLAKCNHIAAVLFAMEHVTREGLRSLLDPVTCTSKLSTWVVPSKLAVEAKPLTQILFRKILYKKPDTQPVTAHSYDPRAPQHREQPMALGKLFADLQQSCPNSGFFLFNGDCSSSFRLPQTTTDVLSEQVEVDGPADVPIEEYLVTEEADVDDLVQETDTVTLPFNDQYDITSATFQGMIDTYVNTQPSLTDEEVKLLEIKTRGQNQSQDWFEARKERVTASVIGEVISRRAEPSKLLERMLYGKRISTRAMQYGINHEADAVAAYVASAKNVTVQDVGLLVRHDFPALGASLDRLVTERDKDGTASVGGLEVKCPPSVMNLNAKEAARSKGFCLKISGDIVQLSRKHKYFHQVQTQLYVSGLPWVDFVVWFGDGVPIFKERIHFSAACWDKEYMPAITHFVHRALVPEILTRRVERGDKLYPNGGWVAHHKLC